MSIFSIDKKVFKEGLKIYSVGKHERGNVLLLNTNQVY